jgi:hypothetical protein
MKSRSLAIPWCPAEKGAMSRFSAHAQLGKDVPALGDLADAQLDDTVRRHAVISRPSKRIEPRARGNNALIAIRVVDFPAPLAPSG